MDVTTCLNVLAYLFMLGFAFHFNVLILEKIFKLYTWR